MAKENTEFSLKFGGEENDINAATYGYVLINNVTLIEEANKELQTGFLLDIKVKSERKGSFLVDLGIEPSAIGVLAPLLTVDNIASVKNAVSKITSTIIDTYDCWKKIKGDKPKEIITGDNNNYIIITGNNNKIEVDKTVYKLVAENKRGREALANTFLALHRDEKVRDFAILDQFNNSLFDVHKEDFAELSKSLEIIRPEKQITSEIVHLSITRQSFEPSKKSDFLYRGIQIASSIEDMNFWDDVDRGESFAKGDLLLVELNIEQIFNKAFNAYENKAYIIKKVIEHIPRTEQSNLFPKDKAT